MRTLRTLFAAGIVGLGLALTPAAAHADTLTDNNVTVADSQRAIAKTGVLADSSGVQSNSDTSSALVKGNVNVPTDAKQGVKFGQLTIELPYAKNAGKGTKSANGLVIYPSKNGVGNAAQYNNDHSLRLMTIIANKDAPTRYDYPVKGLPAGAKLTLASNGGVVALDPKGQLLGVIAPPWAKDGAGKSISTRYVVKGHTVTQVVNHRVRGTVYPVTADPRVHFAWHGVTAYLNRHETWVVAVGGTAAAAGYLGWTGLPGAAMAVIAVAADRAVDYGYCLALYRAWWWAPWSVSTWWYRC